jgi:hypothetical protein
MLALQRARTAACKLAVAVPRRSVIVPLGLAVVLSIVAASCTESSASAPSSVPPINAAAPPASVVSAPSGQAGGAAACASAAITASILGATDTLGQVNLQVQLTNVGEFDCFLSGVPSVKLLLSGTTTPVSVPPISASASAPAVTLEPNLRATFDVHVDDGDSTAACARRIVRAVVVELAGTTMPPVTTSSRAWLCEPMNLSQVSVGPYLSAGGPDRDDNDA